MGYERNDRHQWRGQDYDRTENRYRDNRDRTYGARDRDYRDEDRGFFDRASDEVRSWFGDEEAERRRRIDELEYERERARDREYGGHDRNSRYGYSSGGYSSYAPSGYGASGSSYGRAAYGGYGSGRTSYAPYSGGTYRENDSNRHDPRYHELRARQIEELDRDYDEYRREHQSRFEDDFGSWRSNRLGQRQSLRSVQEHQEVVGADGAHVGTVDHVRGDRILLTKNDSEAGGHHHSIPCSWIVKVSDKVEINRTASEAQAAWKDEERRGAFGEWNDANGPHILNRSFAGTY